MDRVPVNTGRPLIEVKNMVKTRMLKDRNLKWYLFFVLPGVIYCFILFAYPLFYNISMSFKNVTAMTLLKPTQPFVGWANYQKVLANPKFPLIVSNTFVFTIASIVFQFAIGFLLALLFARTFPLCKFYRGIIMIGWMVPMLVVATLGKWFFTGDQSSLVNYWLLNLGLIDTPQKWLVSTNTSMMAQIIVNIYKGVPFNMLLLSTALATIPEDLHEAASIDGANAIQRFFRITVPLLKPTILAVITQGFILTFKVFELIFVMTKGGPADTTQVLATYSYSLTFDEFQFGQGAAVANILSLILLIASLIYIKFVSKNEVIE